MDPKVTKWLDQQRRAFEAKTGLRRYYQELYDIIDRELGDARDVLELGCGIGMSRSLMPRRTFLATDAIESPYADRVVDAQNLPFAGASLDGIFAVDVLHHVPQPVAMLSEALRVLRPGGRLVLVEPYASPIGTLVYRAVHPEPIVMNVDVWGAAPITSEHVMDANQAVATLMFCRNLDRMPAQLRTACTVRTLPHSLLSFIATGGINSRLGLPAWVITALLSAERKAPGWLLRLCGLRLIIELRRNA